jgi:hypothetical protein
MLSGAVVAQTTYVAAPQAQENKSAAAKAEPKAEVKTESAKTNGEIPVAAKPAPKQSATQSPTPNSNNDLWNRAQESLGTLSKTMAMKLHGTKAHAKGKVLVIEFERNLDLDWVTDKPMRKAAVLEQVRAHAGEDWDIELVVSGAVEVSLQSEAVELPMEGDRLAQRAKDILGAQ